MRKQQPNEIVDDFRQQLDELRTYFSDIAAAIASRSNEKKLKSQLAQHVFVAAVVYWESFLSDFVVALINRDSTQYAGDLRTRIEQSVEDKFSAVAASHTKTSLPKHLKKEQVVELLDQKGRNVTFKDADEMVSKAQSWFAPAYSAKFSALTSADRKALDTARLIRNFLAHRSKSSKQEMNTALSSVNSGGAGGAGNGGLGRGANQIHNVGHFLKGVHAGKTRVERYCERLKEIAEKLKI